MSPDVVPRIPPVNPLSNWLDLVTPWLVTCFYFAAALRRACSHLLTNFGATVSVNVVFSFFFFFAWLR